MRALAVSKGSFPAAFLRGVSLGVANESILPAGIEEPQVDCDGLCPHIIITNDTNNYQVSVFARAWK